MLEHFLLLADHYSSDDLTFALQPHAPDEGLGHSSHVLSGSDWLHWDRSGTYCQGQNGAGAAGAGAASA